MELKDYIDKHYTSVNEFCREAKLASNVIYCLLRGTHGISKRKALMIEEFTKGEVSRREAYWPADFTEINMTYNGKKGEK